MYGNPWWLGPMDRFDGIGTYKRARVETGTIESELVTACGNRADGA